MRRLQALAATAAALLVLGACSGEDEAAEDAGGTGDAVEPAPVDLSVGDLAETVRVGVLVSSGATGAEGGDVLARAQGAVVAQQRLVGGGADVELVVRDDRGDAASAQQAVAELVDAGVVGIVVGSTGPHLDAALQDASAAGVATVLPYAAAPEGAGEVWSTAPSVAAVGARISEGLESLTYDAPFVVTIDGAPIEGVDAAASLATTSDALGAAVTSIEQAVADGTVDSVVIAGPASAQGQLAAGVQTVGRGEDDTAAVLPVALTPQALGPAFGTSLAAASGVLDTPFLTAGPDAGDATTLAGGPTGNDAAAFFAALRSAAADPSVLDLLGGPFAAVAGSADIASHDAVVSLVRAAEAAGSVEPAAVADELAGLALDGTDGLAGPALSFASPQALADDEVQLLVATTNDPGVRPPSSDPAVTSGLYWFAATGD